METKWVSIGKAVKQTGLSRSALRRWCQNGLTGQLPAIHGARKSEMTEMEDDRGPAWMIPQSEVDRVEIIHKSRDFDPDLVFELRQRAGWTQATAARELGVLANNFGLWELGRYKPNGEMALRYAQLRQRWVDQLLGSTSAEDLQWVAAAIASGRLALPLGEIELREVETEVRRSEGAEGAG